MMLSGIAWALKTDLHVFWGQEVRILSDLCGKQSSSYFRGPNQTWFSHHWLSPDMRIMVRLSHKLVSASLTIIGHLTHSLELWWVRGSGPIYSLTQFLLVPDLQCLLGQQGLAAGPWNFSQILFSLQLDLCAEDTISLDTTIFLMQNIYNVSPLVSSAQICIFLLFSLGSCCLCYQQRSFAEISRENCHFSSFPCKCNFLYTTTLALLSTWSSTHETDIR